MADIVCFGDLLIDFVPLESGLELAEVPAFKRAAGGAAANVAVGLARLGVASGFMGKVGDEAFGHFLARTLADDGVDVRGLRFEADARTALAFVALQADGERDFLFYRHPSADMLFKPEEVDLNLLKEASIFHFDSISLAAEQPRATALFAAGKAREFGRSISFDVNLRLPLWADADTARQGVGEGLRLADIVKLSREELEFLTGDSDPQAFRRHGWHDGLRFAIVTQGREGSVVLTATETIEIGSFAVVPVDATGAGDAFVAGLLAAVIADPAIAGDAKKLAAAVRFANAAGALATTERGAIPALPTRAAVESLLATG